MKTQKNLYQQIIEEVKKRGGETGGEITIRGIISSLISPSATNTSVQAIYEYLGKALKEQIVSGLYVVADSPSSKYIWVKNKGENGIGVKNGVIYKLDEDIKVEISLPQFNTPRVLFVNLTPDGKVLVNNREYDDWLAIAKINIPSSNTLDIIDDYEKGSLSGYIVTARDLCFKNDFAIDDDTINALRNNMNKLLADNLVGNIMLSEGLKILNMRGTVEVDSEEMRIIYPDTKITGARFNKSGTYFYDEQGKERARFTADDARIGNIRITGRTLESVNYETEGFQIKDTGEIDLKESHGYKMMLRPGGIFIRGKMCVINHPPPGDDYLRDVAIKTIEATPVIISEDKYNFGAKNGQFIKKPAYADNTSSFPDHIYIDYTTNEGIFSNEEHTFAMQDSVAAIITTDSQLDASYVRNLIVGKITNPTGNTYFDLLKGKLNIESNDSDENHPFVIGDPTAGAGLRYDKILKELLMSGVFSTTGSKEWDSKDDFDGEKNQVDIDTIPGKILLERELTQWLQTSQVDFDAGTKTRIKTIADGTFQLEDGNWLETITSDFDTGVIKDNINTASNEIKLLNKTSEVINQQNIQYNGGTGTSGYAIAQSFKPSINCICTKCALLLRKEGSPPNLTIYLKADNNNSPGTTLASATISASVVGTSYSWIDINWTDVNLYQDVKYWIYIPITGDAGNRYYWAVQTSDVYARGNAWNSQDGHSGYDRSFKIYEQHWTTGHFRSQEKDLGEEVAFGNFYESHLAGQTYVFKARRYSGASWSEWVTITNGSKINLSNGSKVQYDIVLTSSGNVNPIVYDVKIEYMKPDGDLISQSYHFGTDLHHWEPMVVTKILNGQTLTMKTQTAPDVGGSPGTWEEEKSLDVQDKPTSTIYTDTWFKWRAYLSTTDGTKTPVVYDITAKAKTVYYSNGYDRLVWGFGNKVSYTTYSFVADEPANTNAKVRFRCADTEAGLASADWSAYFDVSSGDMTDANIFDSIWIEAEIYLETTDTDTTPDFDKLIVNFTQGLDAQKLNGKLESELDVDKVDGKDVPNTIANLLTDHNKAGHDALALDHGSLDGKADDDHTQYHTSARFVTAHDTTARHPVSVIKFSTGSYSEDILGESNGTAFTTNKYAHQIEVKGESAYIRLGNSAGFIKYSVTTDWVARKYQMSNTHTSAQYAYAQWSYHSASQQAIWGVWDKEQKKLTCVLIEEDEGYCKLYPELKENQKLIKIKNPKKYEKLFAWDIITLSKEKQIKEEDLEEI